MKRTAEEKSNKKQRSKEKEIEVKEKWNRRIEIFYEHAGSRQQNTPHKNISKESERSTEQNKNWKRNN